MVWFMHGYNCVLVRGGEVGFGFGFWGVGCWYGFISELLRVEGVGGREG